MRNLLEEGNGADRVAVMQIQKEIQCLLKMEETLWYQWSMVGWLRLGDWNTKYFHERANQRCRQNAIKEICCVNGRVCNSYDDISIIFLSHYKELFKASIVLEMDYAVDCVPYVVTESQSRTLYAPFTGREIKTALSQMPSRKTSAVDGMPALLFKNFWGNVREEVVRVCLKILNEEGDLKALDQTLISLIPKG